MTTAILLVLAGLVGLGLGGEWLVRGAVGLAQRMGISNLVTGLVIVGAATSMPEMVASIQAVLAGSPEIAWGNIAGSNIANSLLILGATALVAPIVLTGAGRRDAVVGLIASLLIFAIAWWHLASPWLGAGLLIGLAVYIVWRYNHPRTDDDEEQEVPQLWLSVLYFVIGVGALIGGGKLLVDGAIDLAQIAGISETVIGVTVVAIGTSLPELAASLAAAIRGKPGLALGNVVGSNIYNLLLIGGVTMTISAKSIPSDLLDLEWPMVAATALMILLLCWFAHRISRWMGVILLLVFAAFNVALLT